MSSLVVGDKKARGYLILTCSPRSVPDTDPKFEWSLWGSDLLTRISLPYFLVQLLGWFGVSLCVCFFVWNWRLIWRLDLCLNMCAVVDSLRMGRRLFWFPSEVSGHAFSQGGKKRTIIRGVFFRSRFASAPFFPIRILLDRSTELGQCWLFLYMVCSRSRSHLHWNKG